MEQCHLWCSISYIRYFNAQTLQYKNLCQMKFSVLFAIVTNFMDFRAHCHMLSVAPQLKGSVKLLMEGTQMKVVEEIVIMTDDSTQI